MIEKARDAIEVKQYDEAEQFLRQAQQLFAAHPDLARLRSQIQDARQRDRAAKEKEIGQLMSEARQAIQRKDFDSAERIIARAEAIDPSSPLIAQVKRELAAARSGSEQDGEIERFAGEARAAIQRKDFTAAENAIRQIERLNPRAPVLAALRRELDAAKPGKTGVSCDSAAQSLAGAYLNETDCFYVHRTLLLTLTTAQQGAAPSTWTNPRTGVTGSVAITGTSERSDGTFCRTFRQTVTHGGQTRSGSGVACRSNKTSGEWTISG